MKWLFLLLLTGFSCQAQNGPINISQRPNVIPWSPTLTSAINEFFRADYAFQDTGATIFAYTNNAPVAQWAGLRTTSNKPYLQSSNLFQPTIQLDANGLPALRFSGSNRLNSASYGGQAFVSKYVVTSWSGILQNGAFGFILSDATVSTQFGVDTNFKVSYWNGTGYTASSSVMASNQPVLLYWDNSSGAQKLYINGKLEATSAGGGISVNDSILGGPNGFNLWYKGDIYECGLAQVFTTQTRTNLQNYVRYRYGINNAEMFGP